MIRWETILDDTKDIDSVCVCPTKLIDKPTTHNYRIQPNYCPSKAWKILRVYMADYSTPQFSNL